MMIGLPNPNFAVPVKKLCITKMIDSEKMMGGEKIYVLYNPETYVQERSVQYSSQSGLATNTPMIQFVHGTGETLTMELFFDTFSASVEAGGTVADKARLGISSMKPSAAKDDVRDFTSKIYNLMIIDSATHAPPLLKIEWGSLVFMGHLIKCSQRFTKFSETGKPVRAVLDVAFQQYIKASDAAKMSPNESPDTAKYRTVAQGDSLWALSAREYGLCSSWRMIADANGIENPRVLNTGDMLRLPAV
ncbi:MAG: LysM peptidoglycan-binding domain-containing protein [Oscillospiraceae bacterium]|jgi:hypothetical protein|nr:LysM peptidoglycan-binding domain-containing protein [Oscillospiraceae bacterium]